jgi:hypothetical protein
VSCILNKKTENSRKKQDKIEQNASYPMTSFMLLMLAAIVLLSLSIFATEESLSPPCRLLEVSNSSMLSLLRVTVDWEGEG